jgi:hypothetical protein
MHDDGALVSSAWRTVKQELMDRAEVVIGEISTLLGDHPELQQSLLSVARREALRAQRAELSKLATEGILSDDVIAELQREVDNELQFLNSAVPRARRSPPQVVADEELA